MRSFTIFVNGTAYPAAVRDVGGGYVVGEISIPLPNNPCEFDTYAIAITSYSDSDPAVTEDSRNPPYPTPNYNGPYGMGHETDFITCNIKLKGLTWMNRPCDVYNHVTKLVYPNATSPYHVEFTNSATAGGAAQGNTRPAVYLKGQAPNLKITVEPLGGAVEVQAHVTSFNLSSSASSNFSTPGYPFEIVSSSLAGSETTIACPPLNNEVNALWASLNINFECKFNNGPWVAVYARQNDSASSLRLFSVYAQPVAPMTPAPWIRVLEDSCQWAAGEHILPEVEKKLTQGVYFSQRFAYPNNTRAAWMDPVDPTHQTFSLTDFLNTASYQNSYQSGNCWDVSNYLAICATSQGIGFQSAVYGVQDAGGAAVDFTTNPVALIGSSPGQPVNDWQFSPSTWTWHQVCLSGGVFDACAAHKYDLSGAEYRNPPIAWPEPGYWQTPTPTGWPYPYWHKLGLVDTPGPATAVLNPYSSINGLPTAPYTPQVS